MKTALIISVYKNTADLAVVLKSVELVLKSVEQQSVSDFITVISEDGNSTEMADFVKNYSGKLDLIHLTQEDLGWQKNKALNNTIRTIDADYFIFIDGDCVLHPNFIENHLKFAREDRILAGKRIKLGPNYSDQLSKNGF